MEQGPTYGLDWSVTGSTASLCWECIHEIWKNLPHTIKQKSGATLISLTVIAFITVSFLHLRWSFYLKIECVLISFWDLFHSKTAANTHKRKKKKLFKTLRLYLVHKAFVEYITIFFVKHLVPTYKVNIWEVHFARWRERDCGGELLLTESKVLLPNPRKVLGEKKKKSQNASARVILQSFNPNFPL